MRPIDEPAHRSSREPAEENLRWDCLANLEKTTVMAEYDGQRANRFWLTQGGFVKQAIRKRSFTEVEYEFDVLRFAREATL